MPEPILRLRGVQKHYGGLRPLRIQNLELHPAERVSLLGLDALAAETFVNLVTGAVLPDEGEVSSFGRHTSAIADSADWLATLDRFGMVSDRVVLLESMTVAQNLAVPFTLNIDPVDEQVLPDVGRLAEEVGLNKTVTSSAVQAVTAEQRARVRLARALALEPDLLILEHASASLPDDAVRGYGRDIARLAETRKLAVLALTADKAFGRALGGRIVVQHPATGTLEPVSRWFWSR